MKRIPDDLDLGTLKRGFDLDPKRSASLPGRAYVEPIFFDIEREAVFSRNWLYVCHVEQLRKPGDYFAFEVLGQPLFAVRSHGGELRAFYNVCQHRAHALVEGSGNKQLIVCPYHAWAYRLDGRLQAARHTEYMDNFDLDSICLKSVRIEAFCEFVFVNLDSAAPPLADLGAGFADEIRHWAPDLEKLTRAHRITYEIRSNWKNVVDNYLECYHCPVAHKAFVDLFDMNTYKVTCHDVYSSHIARAASKQSNAAYNIAGAAVQDHAVWWMWPTFCLLRYPGDGNLMLLNIVPGGPEITYETYEFFFLNSEPTAEQREQIDYMDKVLQREDIDIVESIQRGMNTPAYDRGRYVVDPKGSGLSEHGLHHFHRLIFQAYESYVAGSLRDRQTKRA